jgi:hypothetical protein
VRNVSLNDDRRTDFRRWLIALHRSLAQKPEVDTAQLLRDFMGYPRALPDLSKLHPPSNSNASGIAKSHFERKKRGELPETY